MCTLALFSVLSQNPGGIGIKALLTSTLSEKYYEKASKVFPCVYNETSPNQTCPSLDISYLNLLYQENNLA